MCIFAAAAVPAIAGAASAATAATAGSSFLAYASLASTLIGTGLSAYSQYQQGKAQEGQYKYQAAVARNNATIAEQNAQDSINRGQVEEQQQRMRTAALIGEQKAAFAGNGVLIDSGSPLDILGDTAQMGELDALNIRNNAAREARNYRVQGMNYNAESDLFRSSASSARSAGMLGAGTTLLTGAGQFADQWYRYKNTGVT